MQWLHVRGNINQCGDVVDGRSLQKRVLIGGNRHAALSGAVDRCHCRSHQTPVVPPGCLYVRDVDRYAGTLANRDRLFNRCNEVAGLVTDVRGIDPAVVPDDTGNLDHLFRCDKEIEPVVFQLRTDAPRTFVHRTPHQRFHALHL